MTHGATGHRTLHTAALARVEGEGAMTVRVEEGRVAHVELRQGTSGDASKPKRDEIVRYKSAVELELMRSVKQALDPRGLMNPNKVL